MLARKDIVVSIENTPADDAGGLYPLNMYKNWTTDNYGPVWIPKKGETVKLTIENLPVYERPIHVYEGNELVVKDGKIYINGKETDEYTFKMDYYWMMGDNRHNSADSRFGDLFLKIMWWENLSLSGCHWIMTVAGWMEKYVGTDCLPL